MYRKRLALAALVAVPALALASCATGSAEPGETSDGTQDSGASFQIVASTSVYGSIAQQLVGDSAAVTSIISDPSQDPHAYEATARDQLAVNDADLVILNGGGYDSFMEQLAETAGVEHVITAVEYSHDYPGDEGESSDEHDHADVEGEHSDEEGDEHSHEDEAEHDHDHAESDEHSHEEEEHDHAEDEAEHDHAEGDEHSHEGHNHIEGFNEHVWYDPHTIDHVVEAIAEELTEQLPDAAETIAANAESLHADIADLEDQLAANAGDNEGKTVFFTEPIGGYLAAADGLTDVTTDGFAESVEEGQDVAPATLLAATQSIEGGEVNVVVTNVQTGGSETEQIISTADAAGVPVVEYSELLPDGDTYVTWMQQNIDDLQAALSE